MARRKTGRDISGWVVLDKPKGISSNAAVGKVRWAYQAKKAGHAGTLDPEATGVLAIALGEATKTVPYITDALKAYDFTVRLGQSTNTDDAEGVVTETSEARPTDADIEQALRGFEGNILQVPPQFSAVKVDGERAYARARAGQSSDLSARPLFVESLSVLDRPDADHLCLRMVCGKGGYVRALARDLGETLGCLGHVVELRRIWSGPFRVEDALSYEMFEHAACGTLDEQLQPLEIALDDLPELRCTSDAAIRLRHGNPAPVLTSSADYGDTAWASCDGRAVAVGTYRAGELHPSRVFNQ